VGSKVLGVLATALCCSQTRQAPVEFSAQCRLCTACARTRFLRSHQPCAAYLLLPQGGTNHTLLTKEPCEGGGDSSVLSGGISVVVIID
jgi:hypothetical protein